MPAAALHQLEIWQQHLPLVDDVWDCRPVTLQRLLELRKQHPEAKLIVGHTEVGIERKYQQTTPETLLSAACVPELTEIMVCSPT